MREIEQPVTALKGVGKQKALELSKLGISTIYDLLEHYPYRYEDRANLKPIDQLLPDTLETVMGIVEAVNEGFTRNGRRILRVSLRTESGHILLVWFNQRYLKSQLHYGTRLIATGKVGQGRSKQLAVMDFERLEADDDLADFARILPVYRATEKLSVKTIRQLMEQALAGWGDSVAEYLPEKWRRKYRLVAIDEALAAIHFPQDWAALNRARYRLVIEEFLLMLLGLRLKTALPDCQGIAHAPTERLTNAFLRRLPFRLTDGQRRVILEIKRDMERPEAMHRLVQGDVGSGKTMTAVYALLKALEGGYQGAFMAPTEILAEQHFLTLQELLTPLDVQIVLLKGSMTAKEKRQALALLAEGQGQIAIGTHALIQKQVVFKNLGVVVIDEQHRFGVRERLALEDKGARPDVLVMTATPIPRSLALTIYGDLDLSIIDQLPPGRLPVKTYQAGESKRQSVYRFAAEQLAQGFQIYVVCPLVEESEKLDLENAQALAQKLATAIFPQYQVGLLHGKMSAGDKQAIMQDFRENRLQILVSTTVIEVGVDVPNANVMIIENAERFGLAQLHQLRGRVGRGQTQAHCILMHQAKTDEARRRMEIMVKSTDGFVIAEEDLAIRGPGEVLGVRQSGLPDFKIADLVQDIKLLERSKLLAADIINDGLDKAQYAPLRQAIARLYRRNTKGSAKEEAKP